MNPTSTHVPVNPVPRHRPESYPLTCEATDIELVSFAKSGYDEAADILFSRYWADFEQHAQRICCDDQLARDIRQEACFKAFLRLANLRDGNAFRPWVLGFITYEALRQNRFSRFSKIVGTADPDNGTPTIDTLCAETGSACNGQLAEILEFLTHKITTLPVSLQPAAEFMINSYATQHEFPSVRAMARLTHGRHGTVQRAQKAIYLMWQRALSTAGLHLNS
jgi:DNA-directed RNA polymerase specialized sigma24 family protein